MVNDQVGLRTAEFRRNMDLESFLKKINGDLWIVEQKLLSDDEQCYPVIFIVGALRSGTTLMLQWIANTGLFAYPTNLLSRFYNAPILGAKIQLMLTDKRYNFRDELYDLAPQIDYISENGKTKGALAPNEFWYFWRRFLPYGEIDYMPTKELFEKSDTKTLAAELAGIMNISQKPFALKALILNYNIDFLDKLFKKAVFIYTKRDPLANIESALKARERQLGSIDSWYSFKIPEYPELVKLNPYEQVAGQVYYINRAVEKGLANVNDNKKMVVEYEEFCDNPKKYYTQLLEKVSCQGHPITKEYKGVSKFAITRKGCDNPDIKSAYRKF